jgi:NAD(P)-dependent dehydrogenase (short-subunit alcohol dehydrogenase family)
MASVFRLPFSLAAGAANRLINPTGRPSDEDLREAVEGKLALVTGASHGIGREVSGKLARAGATVALVARSEDVLDELEAEIVDAGGDAVGYAADLTDLDGVPALTERMTEELGVPDIVLANAGHSIRRSVADAYDRFHDFQRTLDINYLAPVRLLLELLPAMRERGSGHIVNSSTIGVMVPPAPQWSAYVASKSAFDVWLRSVAAELRTDGVTATSVYLALVRTRMSAPTYDDSSVPSLDANEAADVLCRAIVDRPQVIAPWWAHAAAGLDGVARGPSDLLMRHVGRRFS